jgi:redox-regulated HSP33 family molecular chaperone
MPDPQIIVITYESGVQEARFKEDSSLLDILIYHHDSIAMIESVPFEGSLCQSERAVRDMIRRLGKEETRKILASKLEEKK